MKKTLSIFFIAGIIFIIPEFILSAPPKIVHISPTFGYIGTEITVEARRIPPDASQVEVFMNGKKMKIDTIYKKNPTIYVVFTVPEDSDGGRVCIVTSDGKGVSDTDFYMLSPKLSSFGMIFMILGWIFVFTLLVYCMTKVLRTGTKLETDEYSN